MIQFQNVNKIYPNGHPALKQVSFTLKKGEMAFLTGASGAGKTTLLKLILSLEKASSGQIIVDGKNLNRIRSGQLPYLRRNIGVIFQTPKFLNDHSVFYNVALPLMVEGRHSKADIARRVRAALDKVGLLKKIKCFPGELSTGEKQRVGIARAVVNRPALLVADEPTGNLDPELSKDIFELFETFNLNGVSMLIATHDVGLITHRPHRVFKISEGRLYVDLP